MRNGILQCKYRDVTLTELLSYRASPHRSGALLSGLSRGIRSGDLLWVEYEQRKARFRIVWVRDSQSGLKTQAAVQRLEKEECPWPISGRSF